MEPISKLRLACVALALTLIPATLVAQDEEDPETLNRGLQVARISVSPSSIDLDRGDTVAMSGTFYDKDGNTVSGVRWGITGASDVFEVRSIKDSIADTYLVWGTDPGSEKINIFVRVPSETGGGTWSLLDSIAIEVSEWPVARIEIEEAEYRAYAHTSFSMTAVAITTHDTPHALAEVTWRSDDPGVVSISERGVATFVRPGQATLVASSRGHSAEYRIRVIENPVRELTVTPSSAEGRTGDVIYFEVRAIDGRGRLVEDIAASFSVHSLDSAGALVFDDGAFVAENPGDYEVIVSAGPLAARAQVHAEPRHSRYPIELLGRGPVSAFETTDLWAFTGKDGQDYVYTGTMPTNGGQRMYAWDVTDPENVVLTDSVQIDARRVNDVKVNGDASWAIITGENASNRTNGIVVLDLSDPAHPQPIAHLTEQMTAGIHNVWINGDILYAINDGTNAMDIVDMSDPYNPQYLGAWELRPGDTNKSLHDVWSDGRYVYLSYWDDGLVILDIGAGTHGGTPTEPTFVSSISYGMGNTHTAYREGQYVFLGDEIFDCEDCINGPRGYIHVIDVSDIENPVEVAKYEVPEAGAHNIWVENGILYVAYYQGGLRIVDVSGDLRGDLYRQGREIGWFHTAGEAGEAINPHQPQAWGPQPFKGSIFVSDNHSGLWVLRHHRPEQLSP